MASASDEPKPSAGVTTQDPQSPPSDNDGGERPVRKQLKETTIESTPSKENGRKRSFEESRDGPNDAPENGENRRKRSRECTPNGGQSIVPAQSKDTNDATSAPNVSENEPEPERPLPATPKDLAKEDPITEVPPTESLEAQLDNTARYPRTAEQQELTGDSIWGTASEVSDVSDGSDEGAASSGLHEPNKSEVRDSREPHNPERTEHPCSQNSERSSSPSELNPEELSGPEKSDSPESSTTMKAQECHESDIPKKPKESNISTESESDENHPAPEEIPSGPDGFEDHPKLKPNDSSETNFPDNYKTPVGGPGVEDIVYNTHKSASDKAVDRLNHHGGPQYSAGPQEKPQEPIFQPEVLSEHRSPRFNKTKTRNEDNVNTYASSQEILNPEADEPTKGPTKKRSREQLERESSQKSEAAKDSAQGSTPGENATVKSAVKDEREKKRHRDDSEERESKTNKLFSTSAFASAAADSPFAKLAGAKSPLSAETPADADKPASSSAFAGSALGGFAGSEKSPFGTLGASTSSVFKSASPFSAASGTTGFGGIAGGFGSAAASKTSFASPNVSSTFGETKSKPLGAEESENEEDEGEGEEETNTFEAAKTDERFFEQTIETGEEEEKTIFACKAKLFSFTAGEWKERGLGTFKVNARDVGGKQVGRMIMRADGAMRVILNSPVFEGMNYGDSKNKPPTNKQILLASTEEGRTIPLLLRTPSESYAQDLYKTIRRLLTGEDEEDEESNDEDE